MDSFSPSIDSSIMFFWNHLCLCIQEPHSLLIWPLQSQVQIINTELQNTLPNILCSYLGLLQIILLWLLINNSLMCALTEHCLPTAICLSPAPRMEHSPLSITVVAWVCFQLSLWAPERQRTMFYSPLNFKLQHSI